MVDPSKATAKNRKEGVGTSGMSGSPEDQRFKMAKELSAGNILAQRNSRFYDDSTRKLIFFHKIQSQSLLLYKLEWCSWRYVF